MKKIVLAAAVAASLFTAGAAYAENPNLGIDSNVATDSVQTSSVNSATSQASGSVEQTPYQASTVR